MAKVIAAAGELNAQDLETLISTLLVLRAQRSKVAMSAKESALLQKINRSLSTDQLRRLEYLQERRRAESMNDSEQHELISLIGEQEKLDVQRLKHMVKLAQLRKVPLRELAAQLGLH
ncbi:MAG: hypothetical protein J0L99_06150 [Chitinophagales bacterium]|nr:hypothetical protein [Chitinophagales bacterium]